VTIATFILGDLKLKSDCIFCFLFIFVTLNWYNACTCSDVDVLMIMVTNEAQAESVLFGDLGAVPGTPQLLTCWSKYIYLIHYQD